MQIFQLIGIAFVTAIAALILRSVKPELAFAVSVAGGIVLLLFAPFSGRSSIRRGSIPPS